MDTINSSATLPIRLIRDANLAWARKDLGRLDDFAASINRSGLQLPILLTETMQVADGARRLEAYELLGERNIPVVFGNEWSVVTTYFEHLNKLDKDGWPTLRMDWAGVRYLYDGAYREMFQEEVRKSRAARRGQPKERHDNRGPRLKGFSALWGISVDHLVAIFEIQKKIDILLAPASKGEDRAMVAQRQVWGHRLAEEFHECEENGGTRLSAIQMRARVAGRGEDPFTIRAIRGQIQTGESTATKTSTRGREIDGDMLTNVGQLLSQIATMAPYYTHVEESVSAAEAAAAAQEMRQAIRNINALIKVVRLHGNNPNLEEGS